LSAAATPAPTVDPSLPQQKLLLEAASKAGEAGEAALSIQLYARLIARYPQTAFAPQARAAVEAQKKKLAKP
jgi:outer membrane protein assembly factor BamD (BamD/ComL family)